MQIMLLQNWVQGQSPNRESGGRRILSSEKNTVLCIICSYVAEFKLRFYVLLGTNTGLNFLFIIDVPPLGKCCPGRPAPLSLLHLLVGTALGCMPACWALVEVTSDWARCPKPRGVSRGAFSGVNQKFLQNTRPSGCQANIIKVLEEFPAAARTCEY